MADLSHSYIFSCLSVSSLFTNPLAYLVTSHPNETWCLSGALLSVVAQGVVVSYTAIMLRAVRDPAWPVPVDLHLASLLSSSLGPTLLIGQIISSILMDVIGRRRTFIFVQIPGIVGWPLIYFAENYAVLLTGRLLTGISCGCVSGFVAIVIAEYSDPRHRGMFLSLKMASYNLGATITHTVLGYYFNWRTIALIAVAPYVMSALIAYTWPESPAWLASEQKYKQCRKDFFRLRSRTKSSIWEVEELVAAQKERIATRAITRTMTEKCTCFFKKFTQKDFVMPLLIVMLGVILIEATGRHFFSAYAYNIMAEITGAGGDHRSYLVVLDLLTTLSAFTAVPLVRMFRRRTLLLCSGISSLLVLITACICLYFISIEKMSRDYQLIPISLLIIFFVLVNLGCNPIPMTLKGELFPVEHRSAAAACVAVLLFVLLSLSLHFTPFCLLYLKVYGTFAVSGVLMALSLLGLYFMLPETKDRTLQEVEDYFRNGRFEITRVPKDEAHLKMIVSEEG